MNYLVATDGSEEADEAVRYAARQALAFDCTLHIGHVLTPETELVDGEIVFPGGEQAIEKGERTLNQAKRLATDLADQRDSTLDIETQLLSGRPADSITEYADEIDAGAIYVGHRGLSEKQEQITGSVAKSIVDKASMPVTIVR